MNTFFFVILPYIALLSLIGGSIYRYFYRGFKVSSLSSQILESKILFFGSRPFHWGIVTLFFGHLIGFLIPRSVLAWNGKPFRLYVLEVTALAFALAALIGIAVLIYRRSSVKRIQVVTTKMDVFVLTILPVAIISGIYTAIFYRWGSSWFAGVMAPYLRTIFKLNPDISVIITLPLMVRIHVATAFIIFGMFPFTRLIHMLVYPLHYFFRAYQVVIWNKRGPGYTELHREGTELQRAPDSSHASAL
ncbi:MAG TPA: respiratory nitrate reductase subunit gamma [Bacteroidales bacterium]|nr:respiratory nitrate reductase subunit gamma [Bacteroidales bacterium]